jgi:hypothetical protein
MTDELRGDLRSWLASRPHTSKCPCAACHPGVAQVTDKRPIEERMLDVCGGCGCRGLDESRKCRACGMVKGTIYEIVGAE